mgnify:CR=1 FL=1
MGKVAKRERVNFCGTVLVILFATVSLGYAGEIRISNLRSSGWTEIERREQTKEFPGEPPYRNLIRLIQTTHFVFEKDGKQMACWISYDSQRDQIREGCSIQQNEPRTISR